jgi:short-subunit dehydrogenase
VAANTNRIVIIGATSRIAEECARLWVAEAPVDITLVGRNREKLQRVADDLAVRSPASTISVREADFHDPAIIAALADELSGQKPVHIVLIAHGSLPDQQECQADLLKAKEALDINGVSPALFAEAFAGHMERRNMGSLILIGSVAGDRGRKSNYVYGAAKGLVTRYAQGLQHRLAKTGVTVSLVKPGPTDTPMTAELKAAGKGGGLADPAAVAKTIVQGAAKGRATIYAPGKWTLIMLIIRHLPRFIFNKMNI